MRRVVITGLGPVSSIGVGSAQFAEAVFAGRSGVAAVESFDVTGFPYVLAAEVRGFEPASILERLDPADWGRASLFAATAARLAVRDARLDLGVVGPHRVACVLGTTSGESKIVEALAAAFVAGGADAWDEADLARLPAGRLAAAAAAEVGAMGEVTTLTTACSASNYAIGYGYDLVAYGEADAVLVGGADAVCRWAHAGFYRLGALAEHACCPFDRDRSGIITGEGGAVLLLESFEHAEARGAHAYAEVLGYAQNCDAHHMVAPDAESIAACMQLAHRNAGVEPADIDYVSAHGTGTPANDAVEAEALRKVFGEAVPPVSSIKSMLGHTMGAASGFGAMAAVLAIVRAQLPPTINWRSPDPELPWIDPVPNRPRPAEVRVAQNDGFAFGGNNAIVMLGRLR